MLAFAVAGCASTPNLMAQADSAYERGSWDAAIVYYQQALDEDPRDVRAKIMLQNARLKSSELHLSEARKMWNEDNLTGAEMEYEVVLQMDPTNQLARDEYLRLIAESGAGQQPIPPDQYLSTSLDSVGMPAAPELEPVTDEVFNVSIHDTSIKDIYRTLGHIGGINVLFDGQLPEIVTAFEVDDVRLEEALDLLSITNGHFYKVINPTTLLVIPATADKRAEYAQLAVRTFYLSNATPEAVGDGLRQILEDASIVETPDLNAVTVRDTPERLVTAAEIVRRLDKSRGEVMLEIEILEADRAVMREFGVSLSEYGIEQALAQGVADADTGALGGISLNDMRSINATDWWFQLPSIRYQFMRQQGDFKVMAQPRLRVSEGTDSSLLVGEEVPVVETSFSTTGTVGGNVVPFSTTTYREVGIVLTVTPRVHHNREVTIELELEISAVARMERVTPTLDLPVFTTRKVNTALRLREGETNVLAGLLRDDERTSVEGVMGLSRIPLLGNLFGATEDEVQQTDVMMSITPHIIQVSNINVEDLEMMPLGSQAGVGATGAQPLSADPIVDDPLLAPGAPPDTEEPVATEPAVPAQVLLMPAQSSVAVGQEFSLDVFVQDATDAANLTLNLSYDADFLEFVDSSAGGFLTSDGLQGAVTVSPSGGNRLLIGARRAPQDGGVSGSGTLTTLRFRSIAAGESFLNLQGSAFQGSTGEVLEARFWGARIISR